MAADLVTTPLGAIEVETQGAGVPVLILHGSPGGIDAANAMQRFLPKDHFRTITVSRPGYLRTPLRATNGSIDHEADLLAAALDELHIERVGVLAWSGGGPSAYRLAVRHPDSVASLVAIAAVSSQWVAPPAPLNDRLLFGTPLGQLLIGLFARYAPRQIVEGALAGEGSLRGAELKTLTDGVMADPDQRAAVLAFATTVGTGGRRRPGWNNDVANYARIDTLELERITCPTLLIHGDADTDAVPAFSRTAHAALKDSRLIVMHDGTHLAFYAHRDAASVQQQVRDFLLANR